MSINQEELTVGNLFAQHPEAIPNINVGNKSVNETNEYTEASPQPARRNAHFELAAYKLRVALLVAFVVVLAAAAVLAALYAPAHMPTAIANIVNSLSGVAHNAILGTAYGVGGVALLSMFYHGKKVSQGRNMEPLDLIKNNSNDHTDAGMAHGS